MLFKDVRSQLEEVFSRAIETGVSVRQNYPTIDVGGNFIGHLAATTIAFKNISYYIIYQELEQNEKYHIKLPDGELLIFQYLFNGDGTLKNTG